MIASVFDIRTGAECTGGVTTRKRTVQVFEDFIIWQSGRQTRATGGPLAASTAGSKRRRLNALRRTLEASDERHMATLLSDRGVVVSLLDRLYLTHAPATVKLEVKLLRQFSEWAQAVGLATDCALVSSDAPKGTRQKPIVMYEKANAELLLASARVRDLRYWAFLTTVADTGRRVGEVLGLRWDCLHLDAEPPYFDLPNTKNQRQAFVPLTKRLVRDVFTDEHIAHLHAHGYAKMKRSIAEFPFPYTYEAALQHLNQLCKAVGVQPLGFHAFRHAKATELLARGVPMQAVSGLLGHANVVTTDRYYHHATTLQYAKWLEG
jgi:integrase